MPSTSWRWQELERHLLLPQSHTTAFPMKLTLGRAWQGDLQLASRRMVTPACELSMMHTVHVRNYMFLIE